MAYETTISSVTEVVPAEVISDLVMMYASNSAIVASTAREVQLQPYQGKTYNFPRLDKDTHTDITTEGTTSLANNELTFSEVSVTVAQIGLLREATKLMLRTQRLGPGMIDLMARDAARLLTEAIEDDLVELYSSITTSVGTTTLDLTVAQIVQAIAEERKKLAVGQLVLSLHDQQLYDLTAGVVSSAASVWTGNANQSIVNGEANGQMVGSFMGIPVVYSTLNPTANTGADVVGAIYPHGRSNPEIASIGLVMLWFAGMETDKNIALLTDKFAWSACYGCGLIDAGGYSTKIVTDAP